MLKNITSNIAVPIEAVFTMVTIWSKSRGNNYIGTIGVAPIASSGHLRERETTIWASYAVVPAAVVVEAAEDSLWRGSPVQEREGMVG